MAQERQRSAPPTSSEDVPSLPTAGERQDLVSPTTSEGWPPVSNRDPLLAIMDRVRDRFTTSAPGEVLPSSSLAEVGEGEGSVTSASREHARALPLAGEHSGPPASSDDARSLPMTRERSGPPTSGDEALSTDESPRSLALLRDTVCSGDPVAQADVEALLTAMARPPWAGEDPRERANVLLSLVDAGNRAGDLTGANGHSVRASAVEALLELGYPYALEVPPEVLEQVREEQQSRRFTASTLTTVGVTLLAGLVQLLLVLLTLWSEGPQDLFIWSLTVAMPLPTLLAITGRLLDVRSLQWLGSYGLRLQSMLWAGLATLSLTGGYWQSLLASLLLPWHLTWYAARLSKPVPLPDSGAPPKG